MRDLLDASTLESISFFELSCSRANDKVGFNDISSIEEYEVSPELSLQLARDPENNKIRVRLRVEIDAEPGTVVADSGAEYSVADIDVPTLSEAVFLEFANKVGAFALIPYLRQGVADMTSRVWGSPLLMPMYSQGDINFQRDLGQDDEVEETEAV